MLTLQEVRDSLELRNVILRVATVLFQQGEHVVVLIAGVGLVQTLQVVENNFPDPPLLFRIVHLGYWCPTNIVETS